MIVFFQMRTPPSSPRQVNYAKILITLIKTNRPENWRTILIRLGISRLDNRDDFFTAIKALVNRYPKTVLATYDIHQVAEVGNASILAFAVVRNFHEVVEFLLNKTYTDPDLGKSYLIDRNELDEIVPFPGTTESHGATRGFRGYNWTIFHYAALNDKDGEIFLKLFKYIPEGVCRRAMQHEDRSGSATYENPRRTRLRVDQHKVPLQLLFEELFDKVNLYEDMYQYDNEDEVVFMDRQTERLDEIADNYMKIRTLLNDIPNILEFTYNDMSSYLKELMVDFIARIRDNIEETLDNNNDFTEEMRGENLISQILENSMPTIGQNWDQNIDQRLEDNRTSNQASNDWFRRYGYQWSDSRRKWIRLPVEDFQYDTLEFSEVERSKLILHGHGPNYKKPYNYWWAGTSDQHIRYKQNKYIMKGDIVTIKYPVNGHTTWKIVKLGIKNVGEDAHELRHNIGVWGKVYDIYTDEVYFNEVNETTDDDLNVFLLQSQRENHDTTYIKVSNYDLHLERREVTTTLTPFDFFHEQSNIETKEDDETKEEEELQHYETGEDIRLGDVVRPVSSQAMYVVIRISADGIKIESLTSMVPWARVTFNAEYLVLVTRNKPKFKKGDNVKWEASNGELHSVKILDDPGWDSRVPPTWTYKIKVNGGYYYPKENMLIALTQAEIDAIEDAEDAEERRQMQEFEESDEDSDGQPDVCDPNDESYVDDPDYRWNPDLICTDTGGSGEWEYREGGWSSEESSDEDDSDDEDDEIDSYRPVELNDDLSIITYNNSSIPVRLGDRVNAYTNENREGRPVMWVGTLTGVIVKRAIMAGERLQQNPVPSYDVKFESSEGRRTYTFRLSRLEYQSSEQTSINSSDYIGLKLKSLENGWEYLRYPGGRRIRVGDVVKSTVQPRGVTWKVTGSTQSSDRTIIHVQSEEENVGNTVLPIQLRWVSSVIRGQLVESPSGLHPLERANSNVNRRLDLGSPPEPPTTPTTGQTINVVMPGGRYGSLKYFDESLNETGIDIKIGDEVKPNIADDGTGTRGKWYVWGLAKRNHQADNDNFDFIINKDKIVNVNTSVYTDEMFAGIQLVIRCTRCPSLISSEHTSLNGRYRRIIPYDMRKVSSGAQLNVKYSLADFRKIKMPDEQHSLTMKMPDKNGDITDVYCDTGDQSSSKFQPVVVYETSMYTTSAEPAGMGDGRWFIYCGKELQLWLNTQKGQDQFIYTSMNREEREQAMRTHYNSGKNDTNPATREKIKSVRFITLGEIAEQVNLRKEKLEEEKKSEEAQKAAAAKIHYTEEDAEKAKAQLEIFEKQLKKVKDDFEADFKKRKHERQAVLDAEWEAIASDQALLDVRNAEFKERLDKFRADIVKLWRKEKAENEKKAKEIDDVIFRLKNKLNQIQNYLSTKKFNDTVSNGMIKAMQKQRDRAQKDVKEKEDELQKAEPSRQERIQGEIMALKDKVKMFEKMIEGQIKQEKKRREMAKKRAREEEESEGQKDNVGDDETKEEDPTPNNSIASRVRQRRRPNPSEMYLKFTKLKI